MKYLKSKWTIVGAIVTGIVLLAAFSFGRGSTPQYFTAKVARGDIRDLVQATGTINAVTTVQVGSQVSGTISKLYVDFNSHVKKGQVIAEIDPSLFKGALLQAQADLQNANATSGVAKAELQKAAATAEQTQADYARSSSLRYLRRTTMPPRRRSHRRKLRWLRPMHKSLKRAPQCRLRRRT